MSRLTYVDSEGVRRLKAWDIVVPDDFDEEQALTYDFSAALEQQEQKLARVAEQQCMTTTDRMVTDKLFLTKPSTLSSVIPFYEGKAMPFVKEIVMTVEGVFVHQYALIEGRVAHDDGVPLLDETSYFPWPLVVLEESVQHEVKVDA